MLEVFLEHAAQSPGLGNRGPKGPLAGQAGRVSESAGSLRASTRWRSVIGNARPRFCPGVCLLHFHPVFLKPHSSLEKLEVSCEVTSIVLRAGFPLRAWEGLGERSQD